MASDINEDVVVTVTEETAGVARLGFGTPMILSYLATFGERIRFYASLSEVAEDFADTTSPEYLAAAAMFAQEPHPEQIAIARAVGKPTQRYKVTVSTVEHSHLYKLTLKGKGLVETEVTYQADANTTDGEICAGLVAALNVVFDAMLVPGEQFTASGATSPITIVADSTAAWMSIESNEVAYLKIEQDHAEPATTLATDLNNIATEDSSWYAFVTLANSDAYVKAAAAWAESYEDPKIYMADLSASETVTLAAGGGDTADDLKLLAYGRTATAYHPSPANMMGAAWLGRMLPTEVGKATWKFKTLDGVAPTKMTGTHRNNVKNKNVNSYRTVGGVNNTREGKTVDGDFIDVARNLDWFNDELQKSMYELFISEDIVPMTRTGLAQMESVVRGHMERSITQGVIDGEQDPPYLITVPEIDDISTANRAIRDVNPPIRFSKARLAGAVHKARVSGTVTK